MISFLFLCTSPPPSLGLGDSGRLGPLGEHGLQENWRFGRANVQVGNLIIIAEALRGQLLAVVLLLALGQSGEVAAGPGVVIEGEEGPELDERVEVGKEDVGGEEPDVLRIGREVAEDFDGLGEDNPGEKSGEGVLGLRGVEVPGRLGEEVNQGGIGEERKVGEAGQVDGVDAVRLSGPDSAFGEEAAGVGSPSRASPTAALTEKLGVDRLADTDSGLDFCVLGILNPEFPTVGNHVAGDIVVIVGVERSEKTEEEHLVEVAGLELLVFENASANANCATGNDKDTAVNGVSGADLKVVTVEVQATEHVPEAAPDRKTFQSADPLIGTNNTNLVVFERGKQGLEKVGRVPEDVVVDKDCDRGVDIADDVGDLSALVGDLCTGDQKVDKGKLIHDGSYSAECLLI